MAVEDILVGPVSIWQAPVGEAPPDESSVAYGADWGGNWENLGYTAEDTPLSWNRELERHEVGAQQTTTILKRSNVKETLTLETTLIELTGDNLALALDATNTDTPAGSGQVGYSEVKGGGKFVPSVHTFGFEGYRVQADGAKLPVRLFVWRANITVGGALEFGKATTTGTAIRLEALGDMSKPAGEELFSIQIVTAPAT